MFAQGVFDFVIAWKCLGIVYAESFGGFELGVVKVADTVFAHQACRFLGDAQSIALYAVLSMDAMVFASRHVYSLLNQVAWGDRPFDAMAFAAGAALRHPPAWMAGGGSGAVQTLKR
jgi:hypothetical protein